MNSLSISTSLSTARYVFVSSPSELIDNARDERQRQTMQMWPSMTPLPELTATPGSQARVHFYADVASIQRELPPDLEIVMDLDPLGGLDLSPVREKWGLENCIPVCPTRWKEVDLWREDWISPLGVQVLSEYKGAIKLVERAPSQLTNRCRSFRAIYTAFCSFITIMLALFVEILEAYTPIVPNVFRALRATAFPSPSMDPTVFTCIFTVLMTVAVVYGLQLRITAAIGTSRLATYASWAR